MLKINLISFCYHQVQINPPEVLGVRLIFIFILLTQDSHWAWVTGRGEEYYRICNKLTLFNYTNRLQRSLILLLDFYFYTDGLILLFKIKLEGNQFSSLQVLSHVWLCDPTGYSSPGSSVRGTFPARILELVAISSFKGSSQPRDRTCVSCIGRQICYHCATWEGPDAP